jgi:hypothetical protein
MTTTTTKKFDEVSFLMDYESGQLSEDAMIEGFQHLIDSGLCWKLQGHYGRTATYLIQQGICEAKQ